MLNPNIDRLDYGQVIAPPAGFKPEFAIGTTYSLDLDALTGVSIVLGLSEDTDSELMKNPICLLEALRATGDKVALFCEGGQIHSPEKITPLYILLEKIVFQVSTTKRRGIAKYPSFHPKFWLIKYVDSQKTPLYRVVLLSRNLTFDRSWDVTFCMDGRVSSEKTTKNAPVIDFINYFSESLTQDENGKAKKKAIRAIVRELPNVHFELNSQEFYDFEFLPLGIKSSRGDFHSINDEPFKPLFKDSFSEILIMSPFLSNSVIKEFNDRSKKIGKADCMLFTRAMSLGKLTPNDCSNFRIFKIKDEIIDGESAISENQTQIQHQDIHAKMFMIRKYSDSYLYIGSLNASHNAITGNVEFMILLKSKNRYLNSAKLSESLFNGSEDEPDNPFMEVCLNDNFYEDEESEKENHLDGYIKDLNRMNPSAAVVPNGEYYDLCVAFQYFENGDYDVNISPLLSNKTEPLKDTVLFKSLNLTQLSQFYKISVTDGKRTVSRIIIIPTEGLPDERENAVVKSVVKDEDCFYRYIAFLLGDNYIISALENDVHNEMTNESKAHKSAKIPALYEKMLQTVSAYPERFKEIDYLIKAVSSDGVVPEEFEKLYNTFKKAVKL